MVVQSEQETLLHVAEALHVVKKSTDPAQIHLVSNICSGLMSRPLVNHVLGLNLMLDFLRFYLSSNL